jgi:hypothetical protein
VREVVAGVRPCASRLGYKLFFNSMSLFDVILLHLLAHIFAAVVLCGWILCEHKVELKAASGECTCCRELFERKRYKKGETNGTSHRIR